jgi:hypothetical protein
MEMEVNNIHGAVPFRITWTLVYLQSPSVQSSNKLDTIAPNLLGGPRAIRGEDMKTNNEMEP